MAENRDKAAEQTSAEEAAMDMDEGTETMETMVVENKKPKETIKETKKVTWEKLQHVDSLNLEAGRISWDHGQPSKCDWATTLTLAFQSIGVVFGDMGTPPLYVYASTFTNGIHHEDDILGVLSLIIYTIVVVLFGKYLFIVLLANDNGHGGTFALYSLICRHAKVGLIPNFQPEDRELSNYRLSRPSSYLKHAQKIKEKLEYSKTAKILLFLATILGVSMVIGDGVLTPCISVLSAVRGIKHISKEAGQDTIVGVSIAILIVLFSVQRFGTDKVKSSFATIILVWFLLIGGIGIHNLFKYDISVLRAFNPKYIIDFFKRNGTQGWMSIGGVVTITGAETMFADLARFNVRSIQISFSSVVFPTLLAAYSGQASYLRRFPENVNDTFYESIPGPIYWPTFILAIIVALIASQSMISVTFAIISQSLNLGCFPRVKVIHTSTEHEGQVYIPDINYMYMIICIVITACFKNGVKLSNAYGMAVVSVMVITTFMMTLIMLFIWKTKIWWIAIFFVVFFPIEMMYVTSLFCKFVQGGYVPVALTIFLMSVMGVWHYVETQRYIYELNNKVSSVYMREFVTNPKVNRVPGIGLLYSDLVQGIPPIFPHFVANIPSIHSVLVFVSIKSVPINIVSLDERFLFRQVEPREYRMFRCVVRYGYKDKIEEPKEFERQLVENLKEFIRQEHFMLTGGVVEEQPPRPRVLVNDHEKVKGSAVHVEELISAQDQHINDQSCNANVSSHSIRSINLANSSNFSNGIISAPLQGAQEEMHFVQQAMEEGVVYLMGEAEVVAKEKSSLFKKIIVNCFYNFLRNNFRQKEKVLEIPRSKLLRVGMIYEI